MKSLLLFLLLNIVSNNFAADVKPKIQKPLICGICLQSVNNKNKTYFASDKSNSAHKKCFELVKEADEEAQSIIGNDEATHKALIVSFEEYVLERYQAKTILDLLSKLGKDKFKALFTKAAQLEKN